MEKMIPFKNFVIGAGISLVDARNSSSGQQLYNISPVSVNLSVNYWVGWLKQKTSLEISGKYNGYRTYNPIPGENISFEDAPYSIWKASITQYFRKYVIITVGINNFFNNVNSNSYDNLSPGRTFFISANFIINKL